MRYVFLVLVALLATNAPLAARRGPEHLLGLSADGEKGQITFEIWASGCTKKEDFRVERSGKAITLIRLMPDTCKMVPQRAAVTFTLAEVGLKEHEAFTVTNPFTPSVATASTW